MLVIIFLFTIPKRIFLIKIIKNFGQDECEPFNKEYKHYQVEINGAKYPNSIPMFLNKTINFDCLNKNIQIKTILLWNDFFRIKVDQLNPFVNKKCPVTNCELTNDKSKLNQSDYVVVHMRNNISPIPTTRPKNQRWIFMIYESPIHSPNYSKYDGVFNLTSTYKKDSDFNSFYETFFNYEWGLNTSFNELEDFSKGKTQFGAALISNCIATVKRLEYINELKKYVPIDVFGKCGTKCSEKFRNKTDSECKENVYKEYKFYLAFENSICKDYLTEKFFCIKL